MRYSCFMIAMMLVALHAGALAAQERADGLPPDVTEATLADGKTLFKGAGLCAVCHGPEGKGVEGLGPDLTDSEWLHSDGSFQAIVTQIVNGVPPDQSSSGAVMAPRGGAQLTDEQVKAVAAYVWSFRRGER